MSKSCCACAAGFILGLTLQGCGDSAPATVPTSTAPPPPPPLTHVPNSALMFVGRWYTEDDRMKTSWGQSIVAQFSNSTRVSLTMRGSSGPQGTNFFTYRVDDGEWTKVEGKGGDMLLADGLDPTVEHTVRFGKCDESSDGILDFEYLELDDGYTAGPPAARKLVYHAIGDSITAGFKAECAAIGSSCDDTTAATENVYKTYVRHLADSWGTDDWSVVARTGVGVGDIMVPPDNPTILADHKILEHYKCREWWSGGACLHQWDFSSEDRQPDVITINLGTNDYTYSTVAGPVDETFTSNYVELVQFVQSKHPAATIFIISPLQLTINGPMPNRPPNKWTHMKENIKAVVANISSDKVIFVDTGDRADPPLDLSTDFVDDTHPTAGGHEKFAKLLEAVMTPVIRKNYPGLLPSAEQAQPVIV